MICPYFLLLFFFVLINAKEQYHIGIINHNIQWHIYCPENNTRIINPPLNDQPLITYQCPYASLPLDIVPIEVDLTFVCRLEPRLIWILIDIYQYNDWLWSENIEQLNISIKLNQEIEINDYKSEINNYKNRFIITNAFYIPFETLEIFSNKKIEIFIRINQCRFYINENSTWNYIVQKKCNATESKTLHVQYAQCDFIPKFLNPDLQIDSFDDNTTNIPDFHVILSVDQQQTPVETTTEITTTTTRFSDYYLSIDQQQTLIETTTEIATTTTRFSDYHLLFNQHYRSILSNLTILTKASNLITFIFIFTIIIFILLTIFFIYTLCYHHHMRSNQKSSLLI